MASCFVEADEGFIEEPRNTSENKNTKRSTDYWANTRGQNVQLESYEIPELNEAFAQFFGELRKKSGKDYKFRLAESNAGSEL